MIKKATDYRYISPENIREVCTLLSQYRDEAMVIAGGTDLLVMMKNRKVTPANIITLEKISQLKYVKYEDNSLKVGALATMAEVASAPVVREKYPVLASAAGIMGSPQVRNMATVAGNICRAAPSADTAVPLMALNARVVLMSTGGQRQVALEDFFTGPGQTVRRSDEVLTEIIVPEPSSTARSKYARSMAREAVAIAQACAAVILEMNSDHSKVNNARIVLGAVAPTPIRAHEAENLLTGTVISDEIIDAAANAAASACKSITDIRCTAQYRTEMIRVMISRTLHQLATE